MALINKYKTLSQNLSGKRCIITGANSGVGKESARKLLSAGADITFVCRNPEKAEVAKQELLQNYPHGNIDILIADLSLISDTKKVSQEILNKYPKIDLLINNAGAHIMGEQLTEEGFEMNFAVNYLGAFVLINSLLQRLKQTPNSRIVVVTSEGHRIGALLPFDDYQSKKSPNAFSYMRAKFYAMLLVQSIHYQLKDSQTQIHAVCPGLVASNFFSIEPFKSVLQSLAKTGLFTINTPEKGSRSSITAACDPLYGECSGHYVASYPILRNFAPAKEIYNTKKQQQLWVYTCEITNMDLPSFENFHGK